MRPGDFAKLFTDIQHELSLGARSIGILGLTPVTFRLVRLLSTSQAHHRISAIYTEDVDIAAKLFDHIVIRRFPDLSQATDDVLVVASDTEKEELLCGALPYIVGRPKIIVAGYGHLKFRDPVFREEKTALLVPSLANGYPNSLVHLYQCLENAARLQLRGVVVEFGMFKGGTTMFLSKIAERLHMDWPIIGFDTFSGFPPRKHVLDMYEHPGCVFTDLAAVRRYLADRNIEIVVGDISETSRRLENESVVVAFVDTDNYTPAQAAIGVLRERVVIGGAIVFDHFTGGRRFRYTLGERIAARALLDDPRYFNLHDTGVFYRQR